MSAHAEALRFALASDPMSARQLAEKLQVSQPTVSRAIRALGGDLVRIGAGPSIHYALRDTTRGLDDIPVYRVSAEGSLRKHGVLVPVRAQGFVMQQDNGVSLHSHGLPWWLCDMRPQGFLGRAYAARHATALGLPPRLAEWSDTHALRALLAHGHDVVGNLLLGDIARERFLEAPPPLPVDVERYPEIAAAAERGDTPGSSAGGEQPKFTAFTDRHVLVKFTAAENNPVTRRWRDLLAAEHLAAKVLRDGGVPVAPSRLLDIGGRRFLEVERFDRGGTLGRRALHSLTALEAEFIGAADTPWPTLARRLAARAVISDQAVEGSALLHAFGTLIGNTDMHNGNLSFIADHGRPYELAPAYDMLPMAFAPRSGGSLPNALPPARLHPEIPTATWHRALVIAECFVARLRDEEHFSEDWQPCTEMLARHVEDARTMVARLG